MKRACERGKIKKEDIN